MTQKTYNIRGRSRRQSTLDYDYFSSMLQIASKYDVDPIQLVDAFRLAWENTTAHCGKLQISCFATGQDSAMFRITNNEKVIWQYPVNIGSIRHSGAGDFFKTMLLSRPIPVNAHQRNPKIGTLTSGMKNLSIHGHITTMPPGRVVMTRWGGQACVSNATIADETGTVRLSLWNNQITTFNVGDEIDITKCYVTRFAGELQVRVTRKGSVSLSPSIEQDLEVPIPLAS